MMKGGTLIRVEMMAGELVTSHPADGMNEVPMIEIFKPVLIWVVGVGPTMEVGSGGVLNPVFVTSVLGHH